MKAIILTLLALISGPGLERVAPQQAGLSGRCLEKLDSTIEKAIADTVFPGAVVAVVRKDRLAYLKAYGAKAVEPEYEPMEENTIFDLASLSKSVSTTTAALQLYENGQLELDAEVASYIPEFAPYKGRVGRGADARTVTVPITVRQLMLHSSGLPSYIAVDDFLSTHDSSCAAMRKYIFEEAPRKKKPGTKRIYSCLNYITLQAIIESIAGDSLCNYSKRHVFDVLGMEDSRYYPGGAPVTDIPRIAPTERQQDSSFLRGKVHDPLAWKFGGGNSGNAGVFSTAGDLAIFCAALLNGGALYLHEDGTFSSDPAGGEERRILSERTVGRMCRVDGTTGRTLGWDSASPSADFTGSVFSKDKILCHTGFTGPWIVIDFKSETAIIVLCSRLHPSDRSTVTWEHAMLGDVRTGISDIIAESVTGCR